MALNNKEDGCYICGSDQMLEVFKDIPGYEGKYQIGNHGTVRSMLFVNNQTEFKRIRVLSQTDNGHGYLTVHLTKDGKRKVKYIHRLVAEAFIPKTEGKNVVNHIDFNRHNNDVANLEWCTQKENVKHSVWKMRKPRNAPTNSSGEKYIVKDNRKNHGRNRYRVVITQFSADHTFATLDEAVAWRDSYLQEKGVLHWLEKQ